MSNKEIISQAECDELYILVDTFRHWARLIDWLLELTHDIEAGLINEEDTYFEGLEYISNFDDVRKMLKGEQ